MGNKSDAASPSNENLIKRIKSVNSSALFLLNSKFIIALVVVMIAGIGTGFMFAGETKTTPDKTKESTETSPQAKEVVGSEDTKVFKDTATGTLKVGGIDGEGAYHLVRPGGISQNVYLTSSVVDLSLFVDKEVKVWGETQKAIKVGWLMDVGRVEVLE